MQQLPHLTCLCLDKVFIHKANQARVFFLEWPGTIAADEMVRPRILLDVKSICTRRMQEIASMCENGTVQPSLTVLAGVNMWCHAFSPLAARSKGRSVAG